uniref:Gamma-glutamylcyclotransferase n=1 Tax=Cyprinus carpio TaxID=7962 RepID=A0A8C2IP50_CYPCA
TVHLCSLYKLMRFFRLRYLRHSVSKMSSSGCFMYFAYGTYVNLLYMCSILGRGSFCFNYCLNSAWHRGVQFVALLRWYGSPGVYSPLEVKVETKEGPLLCRTYKMNNFRPCLPSAQYKKVVCLGAQQNGLPQNYIQKLLALKTNNYSGTSILDQITDWILEKKIRLTSKT